MLLINQAAARHFWPGEDPVGRTVYMGRNEVKVIGMVADVAQTSLESSAGSEMYISQTQEYPEGAELVVRSRLPVDAFATTVMRTLRSISPNQPAAAFRPLREIVDHSVSPRRFFVMLVGSFAGLGLLLASLGIYGVISYSVARQAQEIGIRMALGASGRQVRAAVVGRALRLAVAGAVIGAAASFLVARWITSLLFGTRPTDPATFGGTVVVLCAVALIAGYIPARRASRIEPMAVLRNS